MKDPKCPICGLKHYKFQCWRNPRKKIAVKAVKIGVNSTKTQKPHKLSALTVKDRKNLVKRLDLIVSKYVRQYYADKTGICTCYTCGKHLPWKNLDCGHCISRRFMSTRYDLDNLRPQCPTCNRTLHGNYKAYYPKLYQELGEQRYTDLWNKARQNRKVSTPELEILLEKYKNLLKSLEK